MSTRRVNFRIENANSHPGIMAYLVISPMIASMKSTQESIPFNHSVVRLYQLYAKYSVGGVNMGEFKTFL